ncbi:MAG: hypothetical protein EZS28_015742 [Streblomastix strix]|uniref:Uncharacterized protein n=1 Tax=Streblomastix strix TaxID=222440 RepID=A0A5J4W1L4_9EUKA|nr:MAG: hypothetical protein EZS28_015742 [Streblomastix strix]
MSHNDAAEQILTLARIRAELQDPEQKKAQILQAGLGEDDLDLRSSDMKHKYRIVIKSLLDEDFRKNLLAASESLVSKPEKRTRAAVRRNGYGRQDQIGAQFTTLAIDTKRFKEKIQEGYQQNNAGANWRGLGGDMSKWKQFNYTDRQGINQEATKYGWTGNEIPIKIQQGKTNIEKGEQYGDAMTALSASQSTALTAYAKALEGKPNADKCKHIFKLSTIGVNAVTQLMEGINLSHHSDGDAIRNAILTTAVQSERNTICSTPYPYNQMQKYYIQQPGGFSRRGKEFQGTWKGGRGRGRGGFQTNIQTGANAFPVFPRNP